MARDNLFPNTTRRHGNVKRITVQAASTTATASPAAGSAEAIPRVAEALGSRAVIKQCSEVRYVC
jgi:hypothetical protein